ncbi:hypothetical protein BDV98DRAFT_560835 [Pterulicium gracile]|uniref:Transmembrane protein n=1 Tax=Pterulicium gracile TaxID=1884261 RepID=A0A5C3QV43_9AGAR|nr:hypothetical protein BDV98DRAFT_560835 [Pterula gracilis]
MPALHSSLLASLCAFLISTVNVINASATLPSSILTDYAPREHISDAEFQPTTNTLFKKDSLRVSSRSLSRPRPIDDGFIILGAFFTLVLIVSGFVIASVLRKKRTDPRPSAITVVRTSTHSSGAEQEEMMLKPKRADYLVADYTHRLSRIPAHVGVPHPPLKPLSKLRTSMTRLSHAILPTPSSTHSGNLHAHHTASPV